MKNFLIVMGTIVVVLFVIFSLAATNHNNPNSTTEPVVNSSYAEGGHNPEPPAKEVSVYALSVAYHTNEVAADNEYKGKRLYLVALISKIRKDFAGTVVLELPVPFDEYGFQTVQASLNSGSESEAASLQPGMRVVMECDGAGMVLESPMLDNCSFVQERKAAEPSRVALPAPVMDQAPQAAMSIPEQAVAQSQNDSPSDGIYRVGGNVSAPEIIYSPAAEFSDAARQAKYQGTVNVDAVVGADGAVQSVRVTNDPGMGLADKATEAVQKYRFKPAMKDGQPVPVRIVVQVAFTMY